MADWLEGFALEELDKNNRKYIWASLEMANSIVTHTEGNISGYRILKIYRVKNSALYNSYRNRRKEISLATGGQWVKEMHLFHGTTRDQALKIAKQGFRIDLANSRARFGKGIYFCDQSSKSNQYTFNGYRGPCDRHTEIFCETCVRTMLICRVATGNEYHTTLPNLEGTRDAPEGFHCVVKDPEKDCKYSECVVFNESQAYPGHLVEYTLRK